MKFKEIQELFRTELHHLFDRDEIDNFFYMLLENYSDIKAFTLALEPNLKANKNQETLFFKALSKLKIEMPIQQILGKAFFNDLAFEIDGHVLIPRPETEELVHWILNDINKRVFKKPIKILDIGTGSGCIAISLAKSFPKANVSAIDVSDKALAIARKNAKTHRVDVNFYKTDILAVKDLKEDYDIIVSNPPYVRASEKKMMKNNVLKYEPHLALFVENEDPLLFYKKIITLAVNKLRPEGALYFEINQYLSSEVISLLQKNRFLSNIVKKDIFNNDRMVKALKM